VIRDSADRVGPKVEHGALSHTPVNGSHALHMIASLGIGPRALRRPDVRRLTGVWRFRLSQQYSPGATTAAPHRRILRGRVRKLP
jgi:hypothetical protein